MTAIQLRIRILRVVRTIFLHVAILCWSASICMVLLLLTSPLFPWATWHNSLFDKMATSALLGAGDVSLVLTFATWVNIFLYRLGSWKETTTEVIDHLPVFIQQTTTTHQRDPFDDWTETQRDQYDQSRWT